VKARGRRSVHQVVWCRCAAGHRL